MKVVQEHAEEAGKNGVDEPFSDLGLGNFVWAQVIQAQVLLDAATYREASPNLYGMLLCGLEDHRLVEVKNIHEEQAMRYSAKHDAQLLAHILHLFKKVSYWGFGHLLPVLTCSRWITRQRGRQTFKIRLPPLKGSLRHRRTPFIK